MRTHHAMLRHPFWNRALRDRWLHDFDATVGGPETPASFSTPLDIHEYEEHYEVIFDVPGVARDAVSIEFAEGTLSVKGNRTLEAPEGAKVLRANRRGGEFHHRLALGEEIEVEKIEAEVADGLLRIRIPKSERAKPRQIPVTVN